MENAEEKLDNFELDFIKNEIEKEKDMILFNFDDTKIKYIHKIINDLLRKNYLNFDNDQYEKIKNQIENIL